MGSYGKGIILALSAGKLLAIHKSVKVYVYDISILDLSGFILDGNYTGIALLSPLYLSINFLIGYLSISLSDLNTLVLPKLYLRFYCNCSSVHKVLSLFNLLY